MRLGLASLPSDAARRFLDIIERSFSIQERLDLCATQGSDSEDGARWWNTWAATLGSDGDTALRIAVSWDGYSPQAVRSALGMRLVTLEQHLPSWAGLFRDVLDRLDAAGLAADTADGRRPGAPLPFEDFLIAFVLASKRRLFAAVGSQPALGAAALAGFERRLLRQLVALSSRVLWSELTALPNKHATDTARPAYHDLVRRLTTPTGFLDFFAGYPVLARLMSEAATDWCDAVTELEVRLSSDRPDLNHLFAEGTELGAVVGIGVESGDRHDGGRSVVCLELQSGFKLVYKPRSVAPEAAFNHVLSRLNTLGQEPTFRVARCLDRGTYGWMEYFPCTPCRSAHDVTVYFEGAGALLAVAYAFCLEDLHRENVIASGEHPVIVDAESFLSPEPTEAGRVLSRLESTVRRMHADSVLTSGLLPHWILGPERQSLDLSGFGASVDQTALHPVMRWDRINSDEMELTQVAARVGIGPNVCRLGDLPMHLSDHRDSFVDGFRKSYRLIERARPEFLAMLDSGPLPTTPVRTVHRPTRVYRSMLESSVDGDAARDGRSRSIVLDSIRRPLLAGTRRNPCWELAREELRALHRMDVPRLTLRANEVDLETAYGPIRGVFHESGVQRVRRRFEKLSAADCEKQVDLITASLNAWSETRRTRNDHIA